MSKRRRTVYLKEWQFVKAGGFDADVAYPAEPVEELMNFFRSSKAWYHNLPLVRTKVRQCLQRLQDAKERGEVRIVPGSLPPGEAQKRRLAALKKGRETARRNRRFPAAAKG